MNIRTLTLVLGSAITVAVGGISATACSSSSSSGTTPPKEGGASSSGGSSGGSSSGGSSGGSSSGGSSGGSSGSSSGSGDGGAPDCGSIPALHQAEAGTIFCGYQPDGGPAIDCPTGQECCLGGEISGTFSPEQCSPYNTFCNNGTDAGGTGNAPAVPIECNQISDCVANGNTMATACCLQGATAPAAVAGCGYSKSTHGSAIVCEGTAGGAATACAAGEIQICSSQADCPTGTTCNAGKWKIYQIGFCQ